MEKNEEEHSMKQEEIQIGTLLVKKRWFFWRQKHTDQELQFLQYWVR